MTSAGANVATDVAGDAPKQDALSRLRQRYEDVRVFFSSAEPYANLEWILGAKRNLGHRPTEMDDKMVRLVALWLEDLAIEVGRILPPQLDGEVDARTLSSDNVRRSLAANLRTAADGFVLAFQRSF
jgi:hypothetical protein